MPVYYDKKTKKYFFKVSINNRQYLRRGFTTKNEAKTDELSFLKLNNKKARTKLLKYTEYLKLYSNFLKTEFKITTYSSIRRTIDTYYLNIFPDIKIDKLTYNDVEKARKKIDSSSVSAKTKNRRRNFLIRFFKWIYLYYEYDFKDIQKMKPFKNYEIKRINKRNTADMVQFNSFIAIYKACDSSFYRLAFITFYLFGLRLGELLGLKVDAFDFKNNILEIYQAVSFKTGNGSFVVIPPKSKTSQRLYKLPNEYIEQVKKHISKNKLKDSDYIFFKERNKEQPCPEQTFRRHANSYCKKIDEGFHFHQLRKSTVTLLHDKGVSLEDIKSYVGHSDISMTRDVYLQESNEKKDMILEIMEGVLNQIK